jgi:hypothetical protein
MKKTLRLACVDFAVNWGFFPDPVRFFVDVLEQKYAVRVVRSDWRGGVVDTGEVPDLVIFSHPGSEYKKYDCPKIFFSGEPDELNFDNYGYAMTYHYTNDPRHYRLPLYALYGDVSRLMEPRIYKPEMFNRSFCCVLFGKSYPHERTPREAFFRELCKYKKVDSAGCYSNNVGFTIRPEEKADFISHYKFTLAFESCSLPGFTTEKIYEPLLMNTIPIYWGNPFIDRDFRPEGFVDCTGLNYGEMLDRIIGFDSDEGSYRSVIEQPQYLNRNVLKENIVNFIKKVLGDS